MYPRSSRSDISFRMVAELRFKSVYLEGSRTNRLTSFQIGLDNLLLKSCVFFPQILASSLPPSLSFCCVSTHLSGVLTIYGLKIALPLLFVNGYFEIFCFFLDFFSYWCFKLEIFSCVFLLLSFSGSLCVLIQA